MTVSAEVNQVNNMYWMLLAKLDKSEECQQLHYPDERENAHQIFQKFVKAGTFATAKKEFGALALHIDKKICLREIEILDANINRMARECLGEPWSLNFKEYVDYSKQQKEDAEERIPKATRDQFKIFGTPVRNSLIDTKSTMNKRFVRRQLEVRQEKTQTVLQLSKLEKTLDKMQNPNQPLWKRIFIFTLGIFGVIALTFSLIGIPLVYHLYRTYKGLTQKKTTIDEKHKVLEVEYKKYLAMEILEVDQPMTTLTVKELHGIPKEFKNFCSSLS